MEYSWLESEYSKFINIVKEAYIKEGLQNVIDDFGPKRKDGKAINVGYEPSSDITPLDYLAKLFYDYGKAKYDK